MQRWICVTLVLLAASACGERSGSADGGAATSASAAAAGGARPQASSAKAAGSQSPGAAPGGSFAGRHGALVNPDANTMVFLYYDLAGIAAPVDAWVEEDSRVAFAAPADKAQRRQQVRAELAAGLASVRDIGIIHLTLNTNLSDYDPTYGEFTVAGLAPGARVSYNALRQEVSLNFGNGLQAQTWRQSKEQAQAVRDKLGPGRGIVVDADVRVVSVHPGPQEGEISVDVLDYEMRVPQKAFTIGRVHVAS